MFLDRHVSDIGDTSYESLEANRGIKMKIETMKDIGLFLIVLGINVNGYWNVHHILII